MIAFVEMFDEKYGGAEQYVKNFCGLSDADIDVIKSHLTIERPDASNGSPYHDVDSRL